MDDKRNDPGDIPTSERMRDVGTAMMSRFGQRVTGDEGRDQSGAAYRLSEDEVLELTRDWPKAPSNLIEQMLRQYGPPNEGTPARLIWYYNGPWKRTELTRDEIAHNFPAPHTDYLTNWIDYPIPVELASDLTRYDGSCLIDRTAGEVGARCDSEAANFITLNFMHEIVSGEKTVEQAREAYAEQMSAYLVGRPAPYAERLLFEPPEGKTIDPDEAVLKPQLEQMKEKAKDLFFGRDENRRG
jgi:hypothetical protein